MLKPIELSEIGDENSLYVLGTEKENSLENYIELYGRENVREFSNLIEVPDVDKPIFVRIHAYRQKNGVTHNTHVKCILHRNDLTAIHENDLYAHFRELTFTCASYQAENGTTTYEQKIQEIYFLECKLDRISDIRLLISPQSDIQPKIRFIDCCIKELILESEKHRDNIYTNSIRNCKISYLHQAYENQKQLKLENNDIDILVTTARSAELKNLKLRLYHHKNLDTAGITCDNVQIKFEKSTLKDIDKVEYKGYWNTCIVLSNMKSLNSEKIELEKYIHFFSSRELTLKKIGFKFHRGYTNVLYPLISFVAIILINYSILFYLLNHSKNALALVFYPVDLFKNVIFRDFGFNHTFSISKTIVFILEILFIYSSFCLGATLKKMFGFKIRK